MLEVNVDNLSSDRRSRHCVLPRTGVPLVMKVNTHYSLYPRYSVWDPRKDDWWRDKRGNRRAWSIAENAAEAIKEESMSIPCIKIETVDPNAQIPQYATTGSAGMDLHCTEDFVLAPMSRMLIPTGLKMAIPEGYEGQIRPRSSLALKFGVTVLNTPGTIDSDYRGEVKVILANLSTEEYRAWRGERIAQIVFAKVSQLSVEEVTELPETDRGEGGFGSTGR